MSFEDLRAGFVVVLGGAAVALGGFGCDRLLPGAGAAGPQSFRITLTDPAPDPATGAVGAPEAPVRPAALTFDVEALGPDGRALVIACASDGDCCPPGVDCLGQPGLGGDGAGAALRHPVCEAGRCGWDLALYLSFAGLRVGAVTACGSDGASGLGPGDAPLATVHVAGGAARGLTVRLLDAFGPATLWAEEPSSHAIGTSPRIYFASPTIPDLQAPLDPHASTAAWCSPWTGRHVAIDRATGDGELVVTSVFDGAYVVADSGAPFQLGATPAEDRGGYNHLYVFTFGRPPAGIAPGRVIDALSGNLSKFVGFTELGFPLQSFDRRRSAPLPPVQRLGLAERGKDLGSDAATRSRLLRLAGATVRAVGAVCPIDAAAEDWARYNQLTLDLGDGQCDPFWTFTVALPAKRFGAPPVDPLALVGTGKKLAVTGMLQNSSGQNDACKGTSGPLGVACAADADCDAAAATQPDAACAANLRKATCVERVCRRGVYTFWSIRPRAPEDVTVE